MFNKKKNYEFECRIDELTKKNTSLELHLKTMDEQMRKIGETFDHLSKVISNLSDRIIEIEENPSNVNLDDFKTRLASVEDDVNHLVANQTKKTTTKKEKKNNAEI